MQAESGKKIPGWVWWTTAGVAIGSLLGIGIYAARRPSYDRLVERTGAPDVIKILAAIQRQTESRGNPKAGLGRPELFPWWAEPRNASRERQEAESAAAERGYEYNRDSYGESPFPKRMWIFGSGGPYGMLPSTALGPWRNTEELRAGKVTPYDVFNPWRSTVFFVDYAYRLATKHLKNLEPADRTLLALKRGMASPRLVRRCPRRSGPFASDSRQRRKGDRSPGPEPQGDGRQDPAGLARLPRRTGAGPVICRADVRRFDGDAAASLHAAVLPRGAAGLRFVAWATIDKAPRATSPTTRPPRSRSLGCPPRGSRTSRATRRRSTSPSATPTRYRWLSSPDGSGPSPTFLMMGPHSPWWGSRAKPWSWPCASSRSNPARTANSPLDGGSRVHN